MLEFEPNIKISSELKEFIDSLAVFRSRSTESILNDIATLVREYKKKNQNILKKRDDIQHQLDTFFQTNNDTKIPTKKLVEKLTEIGYIQQKWDKNSYVNVEIDQSEIGQMAGAQLVVPADKANMVLNAANARWGSLYNSLYISNIIDPTISNTDKRKEAVIEYAGEFMNKIVQFSASKWSDIEKFFLDQQEKEVIGQTKYGKYVKISDDSDAKICGIRLDSRGVLTSFFLEHNGLKVEVKIGDRASVKDIILEAAITYIIDLEDATVSYPKNKCESYRVIKGIADGDLSCYIRGSKRTINKNSTYICPKTMSSKALKRTSFPLVRDVGAHMMADDSLILIDDEPVAEKILDMYITSLIGMRYHVAPKMHSAEEVSLMVDIFARINQMQGLAANSNKIGIMNEEIRLNAQLLDSIMAAKDVIFFTNTGFLDYTGSFIDLMTHQGAIAPYQDLPKKKYKTSYESNNVAVSLKAKIAQVGAGMWASVNDMSGLIKSKEEQVKGLNDTGWSPSPNAAVLHATAFHIFGNVRNAQNAQRQLLEPVDVCDMFEFPAATEQELTEANVRSNLDCAIHGLIAYAEPWIRRAIGCSAIKDLNDIALMEDRATARIKNAFIRNWLLHNIINESDVKSSISRCCKIVDEQNSSTDNYQKLSSQALDDGDIKNSDIVAQAIFNMVTNTKNIRSSYVEYYFYSALLEFKRTAGSTAK